MDTENLLFAVKNFIPKGGPSGGDGGRGADVILKVDRNMNTLLDFRYHRKFVGKTVAMVI